MAIIPVVFKAFYSKPQMCLLWCHKGKTWFITAQNRKALQYVIKTTHSIIGTNLQSISNIGEVTRLHRA